MERTAGEPRGQADQREIAKFARMAEDWWNPEGKLRPLHRLNPIRLAYVRDMICQRFGRDPAGRTPYEGLRILDVGCGGGLVSEPVKRLGAEVVGIDPTEETIAAARIHAAETGCAIDYRVATTDDLVAAGETFDVVLALEVVEHVPDVAAFVASCAALTRPGGLAVFATINRTPKAYALAIVAAEQILRWLPRGTHDYRKLVRPEELGGHLGRAGYQVVDVSGIVYDPFRDLWKRSPDIDVNYMVAARKGGSA